MIQLTLEQLLEDYDWGEVFGEPDSNFSSAVCDECPPGSSVDRTKPTRKDVKSIIALVNGENDGEEWLGLFKLKDGRYLYASGGCDYTGWD